MSATTARRDTSLRPIVRLLDANANRALEGLRVCEEIARFYCECPEGVRQMRALRHDVAAAVNRLPLSTAQRLRARDSARDVGKASASDRIDTLPRLLLINFQRAKESLRTLEECSRLLSLRRGADFQRLRFRTYELERDLVLKLAAVRHR